MKCIKILADGTIHRVSDEQAHYAVVREKAVYVPKNEWKNIRPVQTSEKKQ